MTTVEQRLEQPDAYWLLRAIIVLQSEARSFLADGDIPAAISYASAARRRIERLQGLIGL